MAKKRSRGIWSRLVLALVTVAVVAVAALLGLTIADRSLDPVSTLMVGRRLTGRPVVQTFVPLAKISPNLVAAVVMSEDGQFCRHQGVDWTQMQDVLSDPDGPSRGASTITMQTVKNMFLWPSRSTLRKALEIPIALAADPLWGKRRTLEIYLNVAEWGDGVFGAEAAARQAFGTSAAALTVRQAALLATALPNPIGRHPAHPSRGHAALARTVMARMETAAPWLDCLR